MHDSYRHEAMPYQGQAHFVSSCVDLVHDALGRDQRLIVLAGSAKLDAVSDALGSDAAEVTFVATDEHGRNPSRITTMLHSFHAAGDGRYTVGVNESVLVGRSPAARDEAWLSESLLNNPALSSWALSLLCLYDLDTLDAPSSEAMRQSHPVVRGVDENRDYLPELAATLYASELDPPPLNAVRLHVSSHELMSMRAFVRGTAVTCEIGPDRAADLVLAANEIVTNSLRHGGEDASMAMWLEADTLICDVRDRGHLPDPMLGRFAPPPGATSGRGLWLANHLCDLVQVRSSAQAGTAVRLFMDRS